jgi:hypothetical protein
MEVIIMYSVYVWRDEMELHGETDSLDRAGITAAELSIEAGVSEVLIYNDDGAIVEVWVDGNEVDLEAYMDNDFADEYDDTYDEYGYDPYSGCFDMDL